MNVLEELKYSKSHEWVKMVDENTALVGLSDYAQDALGDLVFADVESVKAVSDVYSPVTGTVEEVNEALLDAPESINESPYDAWLVKIGSVTDTEELMSAAEYEAYVKTLE